MGTNNPNHGIVRSSAFVLPRLTIPVAVLFAVLLLLTTGALSQDLCTISNFNGTPGDEQVASTPGDRIAVFFNPYRCTCSYPHRVRSVSFSLTGVDAQWPVTVNVVVYERHPTVRHPCAGPGPELLRQTVVCDEANFGYPNVGTVDVSGGECLDGPIFVAIEFVEGNVTPMPQLVFDNEPAPETCELWYFTATDFAWKEWSREFGDIRPGYPLIDVTMTASDSTCTNYWCANLGDLDGSGTVSIGDYVYWINWYYGGGPPPPGQSGDANCDCLVNSQDLPVFYPIFICGFPPCGQPLGPLCNCPEPYSYRYLVDVGDANGDHQYSIADAVFIVTHIFGGGPGPSPFPVAGGDADGDCQLSIADAVYLINYIFGGGPAPVGKTSDWPYQCGGLY